MPQISLRNSVLRIQDALNNFIEVKIGEGTLSYTETREIQFIKDRGELDLVREGEDQPMTVDFQFVWEYITASVGDPPTVEDVLKKRGLAAAWVSTSSDAYAPFCLTLTVIHEPGCAYYQHEVLSFEEFNYTDLVHNLADGTIDCKGTCNRTQAIPARISL